MVSIEARKTKVKLRVMQIVISRKCRYVGGQEVMSLLSKSSEIGCVIGLQKCSLSSLVEERGLTIHLNLTRNSVVQLFFIHLNVVARSPNLSRDNGFSPSSIETRMEVYQVA